MADSHSHPPSTPPVVTGTRSRCPRNPVSTPFCLRIVTAGVTQGRRKRDRWIGSSVTALRSLRTPGGGRRSIAAAGQVPQAVLSSPELMVALDSVRHLRKIDGHVIKRLDAKPTPCEIADELLTKKKGSVWGPSRAGNRGPSQGLAATNDGGARVGPSQIDRNDEPTREKAPVGSWSASD